MHEKRRWPRYDITPIETVKASIETLQAPSQLGTIGMGGCGLWIDAEKVDLKTGQEIRCSISLDGILPRALDVLGNIQYVRQAERDGKVYLYCGIEFKAGYEETLNPVIRHLEKLEKLGRILIAAD